MLRWVSPIKNMNRTVTEDVDFGGQHSTPAPRRSCSTSQRTSTKRSSTTRTRSTSTRTPNEHLAFGFGAHFCLGASLARLELHTIFDRLLARLPRPRARDRHTATPRAHRHLRDARTVHAHVANSTLTSRTQWWSRFRRRDAGADRLRSAPALRVWSATPLAGGTHDRLVQPEAHPSNRRTARRRRRRSRRRSPPTSSRRPTASMPSRRSGGSTESPGRTEERRVAEGEDAAVARHQPVAVAGRRRRHPHDRAVQPNRAGRAEEPRVAEGEHAAVARHQPVAAARSASTPSRRSAGSSGCHRSSRRTARRRRRRCRRRCATNQ